MDNTITATERVEKIFKLYELHGSDDYIGENVSQIEHMTQAAVLAEKAGCDDEVILAAFFHDIGHLCEYEFDVQRMAQFGVVDHEDIGYNYLIQNGFSEKIARLVKSHVAAKRYLAFKEPAYYNILSEASKQTLAHQGGKMSESEALAFEADPLHPLYVQLRRWDDEAKEQNIPVPSLNKYKAMAIAHLQNK